LSKIFTIKSSYLSDSHPVILLYCSS